MAAQASNPAPRSYRPSRLSSGLRVFIAATSTLAVSVGVTGLVGIYADSPLLRMVLPGYVVIKVNTCIGFVLLGISLGIQRSSPEPGTTSVARRSAQVLGAAAALVGLVSGLEILFGWDLGIDQLLHRESQAEALGSIRPGLMSPLTAIDFSLLGIGLVLIDLKQPLPSQLLAFAAGTFALFGTLDVLLAPNTSHFFIAPQTAITCLALSLAMLCVRPDEGLANLLTESRSRAWLSTTLLYRRAQSRAAADWLVRYGLAVATTVVALIATRLLENLGTRASFVVILPTVALVEIAAGMGPSMLAIGLAATWTAYTLPPAGEIEAASLGDVLALGLFVVCAVATNLVIGWAQNKLAIAAHYARSLIEASLDPLVMISRTGRISDVNRATELVTGVSRAQLIGSDFSQYFTDPEGARRGYEQAFNEGSVQDYPLVIRHVSGSCTEVLYNATVLRNATGDVEGVFAAARDVTARNEAERRAQESRRAVEVSEANLTALIESVPDPIYSVDRSHRLLTFNGGLAAYLRSTYGIEAGVGKPLTDLLPPESIPNMSARLDRALAGAFTERQVLPDGREFEVSLSPIRRGDQALGVSVFVRDVTELVRAERARDAAEAELRSLNLDLEERVRQRAAQLEAVNRWLGVAERAAGAGFWHWEFSTEKLSWTPGFAELFKLPANTESSLAAVWKKVVHAADYDRAMESISRARDECSALKTEYRVLLANGQERWIRAVGNTIADAAHRPAHMTGICIDITEQKRTQDAIAALNQDLQRRAAELQTILDTVPIGLAITNDTEGRNIVGNPSLARLLALAPGTELSKSAPGVPYRVVRNGQELAAEELPVQRAAARGETITGETYEIVQPDGRVVMLQASAAPLYDESSKPRGAVGAFVDITEQQRVERALRQRGEELTAANMELEAFNYAVAHDLRTPLRHIHSFADLLAEEAGPSLSREARQHLATIQQSALYMAKLLESVLELARLGQRHPQIRECDLEAMVRRVISKLEPEYRQRSVEWRVTSLPAVACDAALMEQVFHNLLSNALKFTRLREHGVIEIGQAVVHGEPVVFIRDNGVGFSMQYAGKLFGLFQRLHRNDEFEGMGVGLVIVQRIMQKHGGRAWAESELNKGATFFLSFNAQAPAGHALTLVQNTPPLVRAHKSA